MGDPYERLARAREATGREIFSDRPAYTSIKITSVDRDSKGNPLIARGESEGVGGFPVNVAGRQVEVGEYILASYPSGAPSGSTLQYVSHMQSDLPAMGQLRTLTGPPPDFAPSWHTERVVQLPNAIGVRATIYFIVDPQYAPNKLYISYQSASLGNWIDQSVPFIADSSVQSAELSATFSTNEAINIKMRAEFAYAYAPSEETETRTFITGGDTASPGNAVSLAASVTMPGQLRLEASGTVDRSRFVGWRYEISASPGGSPFNTGVVDGPYTINYPSGGNLYAAVAPISISTVLGGRYPDNVGGFAGPFAVPPAPVPPDTTAPAAWSAPTVAGRISTRDDGSQTAYIKVTFPARPGGFESDYDTTVVRLYNGLTYDEWLIPYRGAFPDPVESGVDFGTFTVWIYGKDHSGNTSALSPSATVTIANPGLPSTPGVPSLNVDVLPLANVIDFIMPSRAQTIRLQRADNAAGTVNLKEIWEGRGTRYLDIHTELTTFPATFYYRIMARNASGDSGWSAWVAGTIVQASGSIIAANTLVGDRIIAGTLDGNTIKAQTTITSILQTAVTGTRWEIEGATGRSPYQNQIRMIESVASVDRLRVQLDGTGVTVKGDDGTGDITMQRNTSGYGELRAGNGNVIINRTTVQINANGVNTTFVTGGAQPVTVTGSSFYNYGYLPLQFSLSAGGDPTQPVISVYNPAYTTYKTGLYPLGIITSVAGSGLAPATMQYAIGTLGAYPAYWNMNVALKVNDIMTHRNNNTGVVYFGTSANFYIYNDGTNYTFAASTATSVIASGGAFIARSSPPYPEYSGFRTMTTAIGGGASSTSDPWAVYGVSTPGNTMQVRIRPFQGPSPDNGWKDIRARWSTDIDNFGAQLGYMEIGARGNAGYAGFGTVANGTLFYVDGSGAHAPGAMSKGTGSFVIPHPDPAKTDGWDLRHCFTEGPTRGENMYTYIVRVADGVIDIEDSEGGAVALSGGTVSERGTGEVTIDLPDYWPHLNERPRVWCAVSGESGGFGIAKGVVNADMDRLTIKWSEPGTYNVMLLGTRKDRTARDWWDRRGVQKTRAQEWTGANTLERLDNRNSMRAARDNPFVIAPPVGDDTAIHPDNGPVGTPDQLGPLFVKSDGSTYVVTDSIM